MEKSLGRSHSLFITRLAFRAYCLIHLTISPLPSFLPSFSSPTCNTQANNLTQQGAVHGTTTPFFFTTTLVEKESVVTPSLSSAAYHGAASVMELVSAEAPTTKSVPVKALDVGAATIMMVVREVVLSRLKDRYIDATQTFNKY